MENCLWRNTDYYSQRHWLQWRCNSLSDRCMPGSVLINCLCLGLLIILLLKMMFAEGVHVLALHFAFSFVREVHWYTEIQSKISYQEFQLFLQSYMMLCYSFACTYCEKTACCYLEDTCFFSLSVAQRNLVRLFITGPQTTFLVVPPDDGPSCGVPCHLFNDGPLLVCGCAAG